jgi:hypothetical protein
MPATVDDELGRPLGAGRVGRWACVAAQRPDVRPDLIVSGEQ